MATRTNVAVAVLWFVLVACLPVFCFKDLAERARLS
jgi:hypothetical protein